MTSIIFLCTGNSCRSQMAEGWARSMGVFSQVDSAGIQAQSLNPKAVAVMAEVGIDISGHSADEVIDYELDNYDLVVTVCSHAAGNCPAIGLAEKRHWSIEDPAKLKGSDIEIIRGFRLVRDEIKTYVKDLAREYSALPHL